MPQNPPPGVQYLTPRIGCEDPNAAVAFLRDAFGFPERVASRLEGANGSVIVTEVQVGEAYLMIGPAGSHDIASPKSIGMPTASLMVYVDDVDEHHRRAKAAGATIINPPTDQYWGDRRYEAQDPDGHLWFFHQRTRDVPRSEIEAVEATFKTP